jgi:hypothetical protein
MSQPDGEQRSTIYPHHCDHGGSDQPNRIVVILSDGKQRPYERGCDYRHQRERHPNKGVNKRHDYEKHERTQTEDLEHRGIRDMVPFGTERPGWQREARRRDDYEDHQAHPKDRRRP